MIGPIGWEEFEDRQTDRQTTDDRRQTDKSNPSVPYNTFACFAGLINKYDMHTYINEQLMKELFI